MRYLICLIGLLALQPPVAHGKVNIWFSPLTMTAEPRHGLTVQPAQTPSTAIRITAATPGSYWVDLGFTMPDNVLMSNLTVCYELDNTASFITQTRLGPMTTPDSAPIILDDGTDRNAPLECYTVEMLAEPPVDGAITLSLQLTFTNVAHGIEIGGVAIGTLAVPPGIQVPVPAPAEASSLGGIAPIH